MRMTSRSRGAPMHVQFFVCHEVERDMSLSEGDGGLWRLVDSPNKVINLSPIPSCGNLWLQGIAILV